MTYETFMKQVNAEVEAITGGFDSLDFADTVFTRDAWKEDASPLEVAEEILENDTIGAQFLREHRGE